MQRGQAGRFWSSESIELRTVVREVYSETSRLHVSQKHFQRLLSNSSSTRSSPRVHEPKESRLLLGTRSSQQGSREGEAGAALSLLYSGR